MRLLFFAIITMTGNVQGAIIRNTRRKPRVCHLQNQNSIVTPPLPLNAIVAQRGASVGIPHKYYWQREKWRRRQKVFPFGKASIANGVPFAAENGRTRAPFWFAGKRLASFAPAIPHRTGSARRKIGECRICKLGSKISFIQKYGVKILKSAHQRLYLGKYGWRQRTKNNVNTAHRREKKSGGIGDYILN